jgi:hypothetical protein
MVGEEEPTLYGKISFPIIVLIKIDKMKIVGW